MDHCKIERNKFAEKPIEKRREITVSDLDRSAVYR